VRVQHLDVADVLHAADRLHPVASEAGLLADLEMVGHLDHLTRSSKKPLLFQYKSQRP